jgi:tRNA-dihydrouridine synthase B
MSNFKWKDQKRPMLCLAPMEGYTDSAYRQLIKKVAPSTIVYTEFTSADGLKYGSKNSYKKMEYKEIERPFIAQIFGKDPERFAECAKILEDMGVDGVDINMGCPSGKVVASCHGSALFRHPELAQEIVHQTQKATKLDVSVKMRLGFDCYTPEGLLLFTKGLQDAGCKHLAVHGRTTKQQYTGTADFDPIYAVKEHLDISVVGNGDIKSVEDVARKIGNLDGVMIGRATYGNPWFMAEVEAYFKGETYESPKTLAEMLPMVIEQCELACEFKGEKVGMMEMRKHLANYIHSIPNAAKYRFELVRVETKQQAIDSLKRIIEETSNLEIPFKT